LDVPAFDNRCNTRRRRQDLTFGAKRDVSKAPTRRSTCLKRVSRDVPDPKRAVASNGCELIVVERKSQIPDQHSVPLQGNEWLFGAHTPDSDDTPDITRRKQFTVAGKFDGGHRQTANLKNCGLRYP